LVKKQARETVEGTQISAETLQKLSFELIAKSMILWRTYSDTDQGKGAKIDKAMKIHQAVIDAMRFHPDIRELKQLHDMAEEVRQELEIARKIHRIPAGTEGAQPYPAA